MNIVCRKYPWPRTCPCGGERFAEVSTELTQDRRYGCAVRLHAVFCFTCGERRLPTYAITDQSVAFAWWLWRASADCVPWEALP